MAHSRPRAYLTAWKYCLDIKRSVLNLIHKLNIQKIYIYCINLYTHIYKKMVFYIYMYVCI